MDAFFFEAFASRGFEGGGGENVGSSSSPAAIFRAASVTPPCFTHHDPHSPPVATFSSRRCLNREFFEGNEPPHSGHDAGVAMVRRASRSVEKLLPTHVAVMGKSETVDDGC